MDSAKTAGTAIRRLSQKLTPGEANRERRIFSDCYHSDCHDGEEM